LNRCIGPSKSGVDPLCVGKPQLTAAEPAQILNRQALQTQELRRIDELAARVLAAFI
jgi:hypothetical protein